MLHLTYSVLLTGLTCIEKGSDDFAYETVLNRSSKNVFAVHQGSGIFLPLALHI